MVGMLRGYDALRGGLLGRLLVLVVGGLRFGVEVWEGGDCWGGWVLGRVFGGRSCGVFLGSMYLPYASVSRLFIQ